MNKYINAEQLIDIVTEHKDESFKKSSVYAILTLMPAADVVEVVRCKDCIHYDMKEEICRYPVYAMCREKDDFCSRGEKAE